jgi:hypothetical protein
VPTSDIFPLGQTRPHGALAADPVDPNVIFIAGDAGGTWRGDVSLLPASPWTEVDFGNAQGTAPHTDSRRVVFDANGNLLQANTAAYIGWSIPTTAPANASGCR